MPLHLPIQFECFFFLFDFCGEDFHIVLNRHSENGHPGVILELRREAFIFTTGYDVSLGFGHKCPYDVEICFFVLL